MLRFPQDALLDRQASAGALDLDLMPPLAAAVAAFHRTAERRTDRGGLAGMAWVIDGNASGFAEFGAACLDPSTVRRVIDDARRELEQRAALLEARRHGGFVRHCHGDLHLRNIVRLDGQPVLFDGVEFNDDISCIDVLYDLAFLLMDLWRRKLPRHANAVWNRYLAETTDIDGVALLPLFLSCRAAVRAKTSATAAALERDTTRQQGLYAQAREYLEMAGALLHPPPAALVAAGGLSGSGKSTLALGLAPMVGAVPGAVVLRSDEIRKRMLGVPLLRPLDPEGYAPDISRRVYATIAERAATVLRGGHSVIVDAVHARAADRTAIEDVARECSVPFIGFWLDAPEPLLVERTGRRRNDPSDADAGVVRWQHAEGVGTIDWCRIDASREPADVLAEALECVDEQLENAVRTSRPDHLRPEARTSGSE
jgi:predicted kinase